MAKEQVGLRLDRNLLERVDAARGDVPRNRWIERTLEKALGSIDVPVSTPERGVPAGSPLTPASSRTSDEARLREEVRRFEPDLRELAKVDGPAPPRTSDSVIRACGECGVVISSPSLTRHPNCGGKIVPPPS